MSTLREELAQAFAADDLARADFEAWEARRKPVKTKSQPELLRRDGGFGVQRGREIQATPQQSAFMDPEQQKPWDAWVESHIRCALADNFRTVLRPAIGEAMSRYVHERLTRETAKLREESPAKLHRCAPT